VRGKATVLAEGSPEADAECIFRTAIDMARGGSYRRLHAGGDGIEAAWS